jgi:hypothetical protein
MDMKKKIETDRSERIKALLRDGKIKERYAIDGDLLIAVSIIRIRGLKVWLWGAIKWVDIIIDILESYDIKVYGIIDKDNNKSGLINGKEVITPQIFSEQKHKDSFVFVLTGAFSGWEQKSFFDVFSKSNINMYYVLSDMDKHKLASSWHVTFDSGRRIYYKEHENDIIKFAKMLNDEESQNTLEEYIMSYVNNDVYRGNQISTVYKYFYGDKGEILYQHLPNEKWLNCGASVGDTIFSFYGNGFTAEKIWAFESEESTFKLLKENILMLPEKERKCIRLYNETLDEKTSFEEIDKITLLNADIEGSELSLLKAINRQIINNRPVISICVYHLKEDIVEIPNYINSIVQNYKFYLRKYTSFIYNFNRNHELVLYAIPEERDKSNIKQ